MRSKSLVVPLLLVALLLGALLAGASPAVASQETDCGPILHIHEYPGVGWNGVIGSTITIEPGEYHLHCIPASDG